MVQTIQRILSQNPPLNQPKEDIFAKLIGHFGIWQFLICSAVSLVKLSSGWVQMAILFLTPNLTFWCKEFGNTNITDNSTSEWENSSSIFVNSSREIVNSTCYNDCVQYEYDTGLFESTIVSEWGLVCDRQWLASFTQMALQFGILLGSVLFGFLSDRFGRKLTFLLSVTSVIAFGFVIPFSTSYVIFTVSRFFLGMATAGTMVISFVIVMETVGPRYRELLGCLFQIPFIIGHMTIPLFAYYFRRWDTYSLALAVPPLIYLGYFFLLNESPRWLVSVGRVDEATEIVTKAAALNKLPTTKVKEALTELSQEILSRSEAKPNYSELFRSQLRYKTLCCCCIWLITGVTFFGLNQYISQTSPDPFVSVAAAGAIQSLQVIMERSAVTYVNPTYVEWLKTYVVRYGRKSMYYLCIEGETKHQWNNNMTIHLHFYEYLHNEYRRSFVEMHLKFCDAVNSDPYVGDMLARAGVVCPLPTGVQSVMNMSVQAAEFPNVWPFRKAKIMVNLSVTDTMVPMASMDVYVLFLQKKKKQ